MTVSLLQVYFRSDKINMRPEELAAKQQQAAELQDELKQQIQAKKRAKVSLALNAKLSRTAWQLFPIRMGCWVA